MLGFSSVSFQLGLGPSMSSTGSSDQSISSVEQRPRSTSFGLKLVTAQQWQFKHTGTNSDAADSLASISELANLIAIDLRFDAREHVREILQMTETLVLVVERDEAALHAAQEAWQILEGWKLNCWAGAVVVVRKSSVSIKAATIAKQLPCQLWSIIPPAEEQLAWAVQERKPLVLSRPDDASSHCYIELANTLLRTPNQRSARAPERLARPAATR